jgi:hypothetical protein
VSNSEIRNRAKVKASSEVNTRDHHIGAQYQAGIHGRVPTDHARDCDIPAVHAIHSQKTPGFLRNQSETSSGYKGRCRRIHFSSPQQEQESNTGVVRALCATLFLREPLSVPVSATRRSAS